jgi:hypothetical protein
MFSYEIALQKTAFQSGWTLLTLMLLLTLFNVRKKLYYPSLFKSSSWLQFHIYAGFVSIFAFFVHTQWHLPTGGFETMFYWCFLLLSGSGVIGIYITRTMPKHLTRRGEEVIFERIPMFVRELRETAETLVLESIKINDSTIVADYYQTNLANFMAAPRFNLRNFIMDGVRKKYQGELEALYRYLSDDEQAIAKQLSEVLWLKDGLDFHYGKQGILKAWLFLHIPLTYSCLLLALTHLVLVYAFDGGMP